VDGTFGAETQAKIKNFQNKNGIEDEDQIVGSETWEALIVEVSQGSNGEAVRAVQFLLQKKYSYTLEVDGIFGPITSQAVKDFQSKHGLTADGVVGPLTWQKLIGK
jgi:peptidoglycan hydrolase-like protein with peptidoglycan-binding domain